MTACPIGNSWLQPRCITWPQQWKFPALLVLCHMTTCLLPYPKHRCFRPLASIMPHCFLSPWPWMATWFSDMTACPALRRKIKIIKINKIINLPSYVRIHHLARGLPALKKYHGRPLNQSGISRDHLFPIWILNSEFLAPIPGRFLKAT